MPRIKVTERTVTKALDAAEEEFKLWRMISIGEFDARIVRESKLLCPSVEDIPATASFDAWPIRHKGGKEGLEEARNLFNSMRSRAGMRKALETIR